MMRRLFRYLLNRVLVTALTVGLGAGLGAWLVLRAVGPAAVEQVGERIDRVAQRETVSRSSVPVIVERLHALSRLETARQRSHHVVEVTSRSPMLGEWLSRDDVVFVAQAEVVAGVDLAALSAADVALVDDVATVRLPGAEVFHVRLDDAHSRVVRRERGVLVFNPDPDLERQARVEAQIHARQAALRQGILDTAERNAEATLTRLLGSLGFARTEFASERA